MRFVELGMIAPGLDGKVTGGVDESQLEIRIPLLGLPLGARLQLCIDAGSEWRFASLLLERGGGKGVHGATLKSWREADKWEEDFGGSRWEGGTAAASDKCR